MAGFVSGADRTQGTMFPAQLEDYVAADNPVRVIDFFIDQLDLAKLGFGVKPKETGRPAYHPAVMLKIYVYGYLNRVQSSRRLERECQRNVEAMWLTGCLAPDFKTIADFRKDNGPAIRKVCREFIVVCGRAGLLAATTVAIDGSKFKAVNSRDRNFTQTKVAKRLEQLEASIERYLSELETADRQPSTPEIKITRLKDKVGRLKQEIERMKAIEAQLEKAEDTQISLTDPDARSMQGTGKATGTVGYNVQCAVETKHHLIVAHEVTNAVHDRHQLSSMAQQAKEALGAEAIEALADRGYYDGKEILACGQSWRDSLCAKVFNLERQGRGAFRQAGFRLQGGRRCLSLPRRRALDLSLQQRRRWQSHAPLLGNGLLSLSAERTMHHGQGAQHKALGARSRSGGRPGAAGPEPRHDDGAAQHRGASLWNPQILDGFGTLPDETPAQRED